MFGQKYVVRGIIQGPGGRAAWVLTAWIVRAGEDAPRPNVMRRAVALATVRAWHAVECGDLVPC